METKMTIRERQKRCAHKRVITLTDSQVCIDCEKVIWYTVEYAK